MPIYETKRDRHNQHGAFEELRPLLGIQFFEELPALHAFDYKTWLAEDTGKRPTKAKCKKSFLEIKCYNQWLKDFDGLTFCAETKYEKAKKLPDDVGALYATRYWDALFVWDLKTVEYVRRLPQPRSDRPENDWVVQLKQTDAIHQWWTGLI